jgi:endonuclease/exonuclease/phosphatase family metal-dependent hydrolase
LRVVQWNIENLFDADDDPANEGDDEFTAGSWRRWNASTYRLKLRHLAEALHLMDGDIVCVEEVENRRVLDDLVRTLSRLYGGNYPHIIHREGSDHRGVDVAMLSRIEPSAVRWLTPIPGQRDILIVDFEIEGAPLTVMVNHWKSRWDGAEESAPLRAELAATVRAEVNGRLNSEPNAAVLVAGDFNDDATDTSLADSLDASLSAPDVLADPRGRRLLNLHGLLAPEERGTFYFRRGDTWNSFDAIVVSRAMLPGTAPRGGWRVVPSSFRVCRLPMLLKEDATPLPFRPFRSEDSGRLEYHEGYSDHLPVLVDLTRKATGTHPGGG